MRNDTYTGGNHFWIRVHNGTCEVRKEGYEENETVFTGNYKACLSYLEDERARNVDYDLGI